ncbi:hypothetical protein GCM10010260_72940 [Streptomyces filipinensis]|uniref:Secreted protein n=1 Tax=Streptomyces filipinensis TaxID=66887 RepID=A0A918IIB1_9ACTN|nr:hypothetical protein [Streptomyces filipinensis]GGV22133.1 hypothetical protein GCM10010260_72940 [Streptomyces filipinensis]
MRTLTRIAATVASVATVACLLPAAASANPAWTADGHLPRTVTSPGLAAAPPEGCKRVEAYGANTHWWSALEGCLTTEPGHPAVRVESDCQYSSLRVTWTHVGCRVWVKYSVSKDGKEIAQGDFSYGSDPHHGGGTSRSTWYTCEGHGTYTLKFIERWTEDSGKPNSRVELPYLTVTADGC